MSEVARGELARARVADSAAESARSTASKDVVSLF
jgi:hypothetical protein